MKRTWVLSFLFIVAGLCSTANAQTCGALRPNESLSPNQSIATCNGIGTFVHQSDGNVVFYDGVGALWASNTQGATSALWMQGDGNLVLYGANGAPLWHTSTNGNPGAWLAIQDDCNLVIYGPTNNVLWTSGTTCRGTTPYEGGVKNRMFVGYQGWFSAPGDGFENRWVHWGAGVVSPGHVTFELYPDVREYQSTFRTDLANLGNNNQARLFSSITDDTIQVHFRWMREHNIDGAALQRFMVDRTEMRNSIANKVRSAAEANDRGFYLMYDVSGMGADFVQRIEDDWTNTIVNSLQLTASPNYARENGKIVVSLWGIGFPDRPGTAQDWTNLISWFKDRGVYVIGGVPWGWRTGEGVKPGFSNVFTQLNMVSPWTVGAYSTDAQVDSWRTSRLVPDRDYLAMNGVDYQPVAFPGFAWSNWNNGPQNQIPRRAGRLFWRQAYDLRLSDISTVFVAMFDEYDEGTAIAKAAENSAMIPTNQYFLTLDADGVAVSSDFYLRLANQANRMLKREFAPTQTVPIPNFPQ
jgi:hypothetical protein